LPPVFSRLLLISDALYLFCSFLQKFDFVFLLVYCISRLKLNIRRSPSTPATLLSLSTDYFFDVFLALFVFVLLSVV